MPTAANATFAAFPGPQGVLQRLRIAVGGAAPRTYSAQGAGVESAFHGQRADDSAVAAVVAGDLAPEAGLGGAEGQICPAAG
ncbi:MAG: hypothetical protein HC834_06200 [Rhodospirillales bacterium]|nr:hypothetical protein [Rhodospirillales bacterium]